MFPAAKPLVLHPKDWLNEFCEFCDCEYCEDDEDCACADWTSALCPRNEFTRKLFIGAVGAVGVALLLTERSRSLCRLCIDGKEGTEEGMEGGLPCDGDALATAPSDAPTPSELS